MFGLITLKRLDNILKDSFKSVKEDIEKRDFKVLNSIDKIDNKTNNNSKEIAELKGMLKLLMNKELRQPLREPTTRSNTRKNLKSMEKKVLKRLDTLKLKKAIHRFIEEEYTTNQIKEEIMNMFNIKATCFYKYLKEIRGELRVVTPRSSAKR